MDKTEILHKEIDLIQNVISRMASNSFLLKGWIITIIIGALALTSGVEFKSDIPYLTVVLLIPLMIFWYLDAYFVHKEKCFRKLYEWVILNRNKSNEYLYSLDSKRFEQKVQSISKTMFTSTILYFYGSTFLLLIGLTIYNLCC